MSYINKFIDSFWGGYPTITSKPSKKSFPSSEGIVGGLFIHLLHLQL
jgi:hypothetical protein